MILAEILLAGRTWLPLAGGLAVAALALVAWNYRRSKVSAGVRVTAWLLKAAAVLALATLLIEPLYTGTRARPGSNVILVIADNSRSQNLADGTGTTRGQRMSELLADKSAWQTRLGQDFDVRRYVFDAAVRPAKTFSALDFSGQATALATSLHELAGRFRNQPVAGMLLLTDGNATDLDDAVSDWSSLPPVFPVVDAADETVADVSVSRVMVSQTNFDAAPVTIAAEISTQNVQGRQVVVRVLDDRGKEVERRSLAPGPGERPLSARFLIKPERAGIVFYTVQAALAGEEDLTADSGKSAEATLANNRRLALIDRGGGPYRVLYVTGRPNWEFKFLRRALAEDDEVHLMALVRLARKEPRFAFLGRTGERSNPLFRGFAADADEQTEAYDEPVLLRVKDDRDADAEDLRGGFPKTPEELDRYHALVLDDIEAAFFTRDQMSLIQQFVSHRGGGLLMLGGQDSFAGGGYDRTVIGEMLPIYLDRLTDAPSAEYRFQLTPEGWLQAWTRVRTTRPDEECRLDAMPAFHSANAVESIKPGAMVLAELREPSGAARPGLVVQPFGRGRTAALLLGDLWRWHLRREDAAESDLEKSWRQTVRWLLSDVPQPVEARAQPVAGGALPRVDLVVQARNLVFEPLDNAQVVVRVKTPDGRDIELIADSSRSRAGEYVASFMPRMPGAYTAATTVIAADGSEVGRRDTGWTVEPDNEEFATLAPNRPLLESIARASGGEVVNAATLESFVASLPNRKAPVTESWTYPIWHQWSVLLFVIGCLVAEWALRRWKGLP